MDGVIERMHVQTMKTGNLVRLVFFVFGLFFSGACSENGASMIGDGGPGDSGMNSGDAGPVSPAERKRVFYFRNGSLGKIRDSTNTRPAVEIADDSCTNGAREMGLGGTWKAWLSSSRIDAIDRISDVGPWYRLDQTTVLFETKAELSLGPRIRIDPKDASEDWETCSFSGSCRFTFWSGTDVDGRHTTDNCLDWTEYLGRIATVGRADVAGRDWVASDPLYCGAYLGLLCIEQ